MKTIDAESYLKSKIASQLSTYPAGSVSKRDIIITIPDASEELYGKLNAELTKVVYDEYFASGVLPTQFSVERERLTSRALCAIDSLIQKP